MGLNPEALAALESLRQQLVADGHPDEREEPAPEKPKSSRPKKDKPKRNKKPPKPRQETKKAIEPTVEETDEVKVEVSKEPKRRQGKDGKVYPTPTQKRRARRKRVLEREKLAAETTAGPTEVLELPEIAETTGPTEPVTPPTA